MDHSENRHALRWGGRLSQVSVTTVDYGPSLIRRHKRRLQGLWVWYSIHFGYYFYASRGDILVVNFRGVNGRKKIAETTFKENRTRVLALTERDSSDSRTLPSAAKYESRLPYTIGSDPRRLRLVRWSDGSDSRIVGYVGE